MLVNSRCLYGILFLFVCLEPIPLNAATLKLNDYLSALQANDAEYKQLQIKKKQISYLLESSIDEKAAELSVSADRGFGNDGVDTKSISTQLEKDFLDSGTSVSFSHSEIENTDSNQRLSELEVEQSLLKNKFGNQVRLQKNILGTQEEIDTLNALNTYETYLNGKLTLYLQYAELQQEELFLKDMYDKSQALYDFIQKKVSKHAANTLDQMRAHLQLVQREQDLLDIKRRRQVMQQDLMKGTGLSNVIDTNQDTFINVENISDLKQFYPSKINGFEVDRYRLYRVATLNKALGLSEYKLAKDDSRADLSVFGAYKVDDSTRYNNSVNRGEASVGVKFSFPFGDKKSKANKKIQELNYDYQRLGENATHEQLLTEFRQREEELRQRAKKLSLFEKKVELIKGILNKETIRYERGQVDIDRIIDTYNDLFSYQLEYHQEQVDFNLLYLQWLDFNDQLLYLVLPELASQ